MSEKQTGSDPPLKPLFWIGSSRKELRKFPEEVKDAFGFALYRAQMGAKHIAAKPLKGFGGAGVLEIIEEHEGNAFRGVYTVKFEGAVYVLDVFQKKSKRGSRTPLEDIERIRRRLKSAQKHYEQWRRETDT